MNNTEERIHNGTGHVGNSMFGLVLVGGGAAWFLHLLLAVVLAEFGCVAGWGDIRFGGINLVAWLLLVVTVVSLAAGVAVTILSYRLGGKVALRAEMGDSREGARMFAARTAFIANMVFVFVILMESVPIFYFLHDC